MATTVRFASAADIDTLLFLNAEVQSLHATLYPENFKPTADAEGLRTMFAARLANPETRIALAEAGGAPVGYVYFETQALAETPFSPARRRVYLRHLCVVKAMQRRGVATALLRVVEQHAAAEGLSEIAVDAWAANVGALSFFQSRGFTALNIVLRKTVPPCSSGFEKASQPVAAGRPSGGRPVEDKAVMQSKLKFYGWGHEGEGLTDAERASLFRFLAERLGVEPRLWAPPRESEIALRPPRLAPRSSLARVMTADPYERLLHAYGKSYPETVRAFARDFQNAPDLVALPESEADVAAVLDWASGANVAVIPFGGGSSVVGGVEPAVGEAYAAAVSLDMRKLSRVVEVDATSRAARIEAGVRGPAIEAALKPHGFAIRHYPQSFEHSTLGGWIATRSGGHFATLYTHIDDFVESLRTVAPAGAMESRRLPGSGAGPSPDRMIIGSEGALGVIVEAWMRLQGRPRFRADAAFGFPDFFAAARAVRAVAQAGLFPSNLRVIDNDEAGTYGVNVYGESLVVLAFESSDHPLDAWIQRAAELMVDHGGRRHADADAALRWRTAFLRMPYARELTVPMGVINDTFESAIPWDGFEAFHTAVRKATEEAVREATGREGAVSTRFTHVYPDGPAVYYTFNVKGDPGRLIEQWRHIKTRVSDALIEAGGTITHHHAVGRDHMPWYRLQRPALFGAALAAAKRALDPAGIMNPGVLLP